MVVLLLALGIGLNTAMFGILDAWLLEPLHFPDPARLVIALKSEARNPSEPKVFIGYRDWEDWSRTSRSFTHLAAIFWRSFEPADSDAGEGVFGMIVTANLFDTLGVPAERGRTFRAEDVTGPPVAVIGHALWKERFGGAKDVIGKSIHLGAKNYQIIGVLPPGFGLRMIDQGTDAQFYALIQGDEKLYSAGGLGPVAGIGRLKPGVAIQSAQSELAAIQRRLDVRYPDNPRGFTVLLTSLQNDNTRNVRSSLWLSAVAVGFVLLIVCANVGSLQLGHGLQRQREMAVRIALGCGRGRLVLQLLTESAVISMFGAIAGIGFAYASIKIFAAVNPFGRMPPNPIAIDWRALAFAVAASVISTLICGLAPALQAARADLNEVIKASGRSLTSGRSSFRTQALLVTAQVALSLVLLVGATLMVQTLSELDSHPLGFRVENISVTEISIPRGQWNDAAARVSLYDRIMSKLKALPGVESAGISDLGPLSSGFDDRFSIEGQPEPSPEAAPKAGHQAITPEYLATLGIALLAGRSFTDQDADKSAKVVIVNQTVAHRWLGDNHAVGAYIRLREDREWRTIVGVAGDTSSVFYNRVDWLIEPRIFLPMKQTGADSASPVARQVYAVTRGREITAESARNLLRSIDPSLRPGRVRRMQDHIDDAIRPTKLRTRVLSAFAVVSLLLSAIGIYGVMAQSVVQRSREIGIRMALGAQAMDVARMVMRQGLRMALAGLLVGTVGALWLAKIIAGLLYGVKPTDVLTFALAALVLLGAVGLASLLPARAAARTDPLVTLRDE